MISGQQWQFARLTGGGLYLEPIGLFLNLSWILSKTDLARGTPQSWHLGSKEVPQSVFYVLNYPARALACRIELRSSEPPY